MDLEEIQRRLLAIFPIAGGRFPEGRLDDMIELVQVGEPAIALENFCSELFEWEVVIPQRVYGEIVALAQYLRIKPFYWEDLAVEPE